MVAPPTRPERGQAVPLLAVVLVLAAGAALVVVEVGVAAVEAGRARRAADAAALAAALVEPAAATDAAGEAAERNGAHLLEVHRTHRGATVVVRAGRATATASAASLAPDPSAGGLSPALAAALHRAEAVLGHPVPLLAAAPHGITVDADTAEALRGVVALVGLCPRSLPVDPVDFEPCPPTPP